MAYRTIAVATAAALLAGCATASEGFLREALLACRNGDQNSCGVIPQLQMQVFIEHQQQAAAIAAAADGLARAADSIAAAQQSRRHR